MAGGMAGLATTPVAPAPAPARSRRGLLATIAAVCLVAILGGGAYWAYAAFLNPSQQLEAARFLPDTTVAYASLDLIALGSNSHHFSTSDATGQPSVGDALKTSLGLDWKTDVLPWLGRSIAIGAFSGPKTGGSSNIEGALLLQSHDDTAAAAAVNKALAHLEQHGQRFTTSSYGNYTLHAMPSEANNGGVLASGTGLVLLASNMDATHAVIDRANGHGATLSNVAEFQRATGDLPANRFGTMYFNLHALADLAGPAGSTLSASILDVYPSAAASLQWTQAGMRWQATLKAARGGTPTAVVSGDTTGLATLVPRNATVYAGVANLGALVRSATALVSPAGGTTPDPLQAALGIAASDSTLQQRAAFALLGNASNAGDAGRSGVVLIREASAADATRLLTQIAQKSGLSMQSTTVDGVSATQLVSANPTGAGLPTLFGPGATPGAKPAPATAIVTTAPEPTAVGVEAYVNSTMVVASSPAALQAVIEVAKGSSGSLAQASGFSHLAASAPSNAAASAYLDVSALQSLVHAAGSTAQFQTTASLLTLIWNNTELQMT